MARIEFRPEFKNQVVQFIVGKCVNGKPPRGTMKEAQLKFNISRQSCTRLWNAAKKQQAAGQVIQLVNNKKTRYYPKRVAFDVHLLMSLHYSKRKNLLSLSANLKCSKTIVWRWVKAGLIRPHTSAIRPDLTAENKLLRMRFSLEALELDMILNRIRFNNMHNTIHIDEKGFYITKVSRQLFGSNGECLFDGKIGIFPFTKQVAAQRSSKNRPASTIETNPIESITKIVIKDCLITKIIPAIMAKWPDGASKYIKIQQDNAKPHISNDDPDFIQAANQNGFSMSLGNTVIAGAEVFEGAEGIEGSEHIAGAKVIEGAEDVEEAENIAGAEHIAGTEVIAGSEHIKGAKVIEGDKDVEGTEEV
ncbi:uncharacterized protein LOC121800747 [Salvia splendens]|uniref:uncharacterized protein LOC121800747 n=1 Tax=Salvia splendens TaxID=180675 RepID=UPI001C255361|nr:uncharacterized protein LOC121800747 [Salvia splendens]